MEMRSRAETAEESAYQMRAEVSREREKKSALQQELDTARAETSRVMNQLSAFDLQAATFAEEKQRLADQVRRSSGYAGRITVVAILQADGGCAEV
jgi:hypothetical protein